MGSFGTTLYVRKVGDGCIWSYLEIREKFLTYSKQLYNFLSISMSVECSELNVSKRSTIVTCL